MPLTPIHVKGKRRRSPGTNVPMALQQQIQPLRAMKARRRRSLASVMGERALRLRPRLDALPDEILETILLYSQSMALPRVSNLVGKRLSGRATLLRLIICAFRDTWAQWFGVPADPNLVRGPWRKGGVWKLGFPTDGDPIFQSEVLEQPWINVDLLLQAQQTWADQNAPGAWYQHSLPWDKDEEPPDPSLPKHEHKGGFSHFNARACFEADYQQALQWWAFKCRDFLSDDWWPMRDIHPNTRIPRALITGPWDEDAQRLLFWLYRGGFETSRDNDAVGWELKVQLLRNAVLDVSEPERNALVLNCLVDRPFFGGFPLDFVREQRASLQRRLEWGGDTPEGRTVVRALRDLLMNLSDHALALGQKRGSSLHFFS